MTAEAQAGRDEQPGRPMLPPPAVAKVGHSARMPLLQKNADLHERIGVLFRVWQLVSACDGAATKEFRGHREGRRRVRGCW